MATSYTLDAAGQITTDSDGVTYEWDAAGNLTGTSDGDSYSWDGYGRLTTATTSNGSGTYAWAGDSTRSTVDDNVQLWDRLGGYETLISDGTESFLHVDGTPTQTGGEWLLGDAVGGIRNTITTDGTGGDTTTFTVFGESTVTGVFGFAGEQTDNTGLHHLRARPCDPTLGRFLSVDPATPGAPGTIGYGHYTYAGANPTTWTDPSGRAVLSEELTLEQEAVLVGGAAVLVYLLAVHLRSLAVTISFTLPWDCSVGTGSCEPTGVRLPVWFGQKRISPTFGGGGRLEDFTGGVAIPVFSLPQFPGILIAEGNRRLAAHSMLGTVDAPVCMIVPSTAVLNRLGEGPLPSPSVVITPSQRDLTVLGTVVSVVVAKLPVPPC